MIPQILQGAALLTIVAMGGLIAERSGVLNIGLEGLITVGAFTAVLLDAAGLPTSFAIVGAAAAGLLPMAIFVLVSIRYQANPFIVGLAINLLAAGTAPLLSEIAFETRGSIRIDAEAVSVGMVVLAAVLATVLARVFLYGTATGIRLRIAGEQPDWLTLNRLSPDRYRALGLLVSGVLAALAGALLVFRIGAYLPNISAGRGWIALVVLYLGYRRPGGIALAGLFFAAMEALAVRAQAVIGMPPTVLLALPYLLTLIAFVTYSALRKDR